MLIDAKVLNQEAVRLALITALALKTTIVSFLIVYIRRVKAYTV